MKVAALSTRFSITLPTGSRDGVYFVELRDSYGKVIAVRRAIAANPFFPYLAFLLRYLYITLDSDTDVKGGPMRIQF